MVLRIGFVAAVVTVVVTSFVGITVVGVVEVVTVVFLDPDVFSPRKDQRYGY